MTERHTWCEIPHGRGESTEYESQLVANRKAQVLKDKISSEARGEKGGQSIDFWIYIYIYIMGRPFFSLG